GRRGLPGAYPGAWSSWLVTAYADSIISIDVEISSWRRYPRNRNSSHGEKRGGSMATESPTEHRNEPPEALHAIGVVVGLAAVLALIAIAFALPAAKSKPHDVPIGAVGPPAASGQ